MNSYFNKYSSAAPLASFRIFFGAMLFISILRFSFNGWIDLLYIQPKYFFPYYGFEFISHPGKYIYGLFALCGVSSVLVTLGLYYRIAIISLFLSFTYIELIDKTTYLNHYYFVSLISFIMIFLPANCFFSFDSYRNKKLQFDNIPIWFMDSIKLMVCILYFYAGIAKINSDWLFHALPLKIWLPAKNDLPLIGQLLNLTWVHYIFSWFGCIYDLTIPFLLWNKKTRIPAYLTVVIFHLFTSVLFPIGIFPYVMMVTALVFFSELFHLNLLNAIGRIINVKIRTSNLNYVISTNFKKTYVIVFTVFFLFQILFPFRYLLYPGELFWTEEGYRFSWRVMLMEKVGYSQFTVIDNTGKYKVVNNDLFLTDLQEKMMATQPDMTLQYAHILARHYEEKGFISPQVYVDSYVALNGRRGRPFIDPKTDLAKEKESFRHKDWILPFNEEIKGF